MTSKKEPVGTNQGVEGKRDWWGRDWGTGNGNKGEKVATSMPESLISQRMGCFPRDKLKESQTQSYGTLIICWTRNL